MEPLATVLWGAAGVGFMVWWIWSVVIAYRKSPVLGIAFLLVPLMILYTTVTDPKLMWRPALVLLATLAAAIGAAQLEKP